MNVVHVAVAVRNDYPGQENRAGNKSCIRGTMGTRGRAQHSRCCPRGVCWVSPPSQLLPPSLRSSLPLFGQCP